MAGEPPFERYPGPPRRDGATFRVISPWRDALTWVSIAGRLAVTSYLLRRGDGWVEALDDPHAEEPLGPMWELAGRDPVEVVFRTLSGPEITASVTVSRESCDIRFVPAIDEADIARWTALPPSTMTRVEANGVVIRIVPKTPAVPSAVQGSRD